MGSVDIPRVAHKGQGLLEYALILILVAVIVLAILAVLGPRLGNMFSNVVLNL
jgi:pilus assembly protein Flp/PilA